MRIGRLVICASSIRNQHLYLSFGLLIYSVAHNIYHKQCNLNTKTSKLPLLISLMQILPHLPLFKKHAMSIGERTQGRKKITILKIIIYGQINDRCHVGPFGKLLTRGPKTNSQRGVWCTRVVTQFLVSHHF